MYKLEKVEIVEKVVEKPVPPPRRSRSDMKIKTKFGHKIRPLSDAQESPVIESNLDRLKMHSDMEM